MLLNHKSKKILPFAATSMNLEGIMLRDRKRQIPYDFTYMWNLKNKQTNKTKQKQTYRYREKTGGF